MIFKIKHTANWEYIRQRKQKNLINKNDKRENAGCIIHEYKVGEKVLLKRGNENKYESPYQGPFEILKVNDNGTVRLTPCPLCVRERRKSWGRMQYADF